MRKLACCRASKSQRARENKALSHAKVPGHQPDKCGTKAKARINQNRSGTSSQRQPPSLPHWRWPSTEAAAATLAAFVVITSFCSRCRCCRFVPCRWHEQQKKKKAARGFLAARAICGLSTRSANNESAFQLLLLLCIANRRCQWTVTSCHLHSGTNSMGSSLWQLATPTP